MRSPAQTKTENTFFGNGVHSEEQVQKRRAFDGTGGLFKSTSGHFEALYAKNFLIVVLNMTSQQPTDFCVESSKNAAIERKPAKPNVDHAFFPFSWRK